MTWLPHLDGEPPNFRAALEQKAPCRASLAIRVVDGNVAAVGRFPGL
jgi:hypothetical protein